MNTSSAPRGRIGSLLPSSGLRRWSARLALVSTLASTLSFTAPARADDRAALDRARADFQRALELKSAGDFTGALKLLREVGQVKMTPQVRYHIATCEEGLGKLVAALGGYELALSQSENMPESFLTEVQAAVASLRARIPRIVIVRGAGADAAAIRLDDVALGGASIGVEIPIDPGPHAVTASAPGYEKYARTVSLTEAENQTITVELVALPDEEPTPLAPAPVAPVAPPPSGYGALPFVLGGVGVAGLAVGAVLLPLSQDKSGQVKDLCGGEDCTGLGRADWNTARALADDARTLEAVGWVSIGVGAASLATGAVLFWLDPARRAEAAESAKDAPHEGVSVRFVPGAPRANAGVSFVGTF